MARHQREVTWVRPVMICLGFTLLAFATFWYAKARLFPGLDGPVAFDGNYYALIGDEGYAFDGRIEKQQSTAFLPLMGVAIALARLLIPGHSPLAEIAALGSVLMFLTLLAIHRTTHLLTNSAAAVVAVALWALSPLSFYTFTGYADPLFAALTAWALLFVIQQRFWGACALAGLAMLTRPHAAVLLLFVLGALLWSRRHEWRTIHATALPGQVALAVLPIMIFATYCAIQFGDSAVYVNSLEAWRNGSFLDGNLPFWEALVYFVKVASSGAHAVSPWTVFLATVAFMVMIGIGLFGLEGPKPLVILYVSTVIFLFGSISFDAINLARHLFYLAPWPVLVAIAHVQRTPTWWARLPVLAVWFVFTIAINVIAAGRYYRGEWVS